MAEVSDLPQAWEACTTIRRRFQRGLTWLQWPVNVEDVGGKDEEIPSIEDGDGEDPLTIPRNPICTKALELNIDALHIMLDNLNGEFVDIYALQKEASIYIIYKIIAPKYVFACFIFFCWSNSA